MNHFGELLREARKQAKLTQQELAARVDVDDTYISKIETGKFPPPSREVVLKLAKALGISNKADRLSFLLAARAASEEDLEGFALVSKSEGETPGFTDSQTFVNRRMPGSETEDEADIVYGSPITIPDESSDKVEQLQKILARLDELRMMVESLIEEER